MNIDMELEDGIVLPSAEQLNSADLELIISTVGVTPEQLQQESAEGGFTIDIEGDTEQGVLDFDLAGDMGIEVEGDTEIEIPDLSETDAGIGLNPSLLGFEQVDVVAELAKERSYILDAEKQLFVKDEIDASQCKLDHNLFTHCPPVVVAIIATALRDIVTEDSAQVNAQGGLTGEFENEEHLKEVVQKVLDIAWDVTGWSPSGYRERTASAIRQMYVKFFMMLTTKSITTRGSLAQYVDKSRFDTTFNVVQYNVVPFMQLGDLLTELGSAGDFEFTYNIQGVISEEATQLVKKQNLKKHTMKFKDYFDAAIGLLQSEETCSKLNITQDQSRGFSLGEMLRRMFHYEIAEGIISLEKLQYSAEREQLINSCLDVLEEGVSNNSLACDLVLLVVLALSSSGDSANGVVDNIFAIIGVYLNLCKSVPTQTKISFFTGIHENRDPKAAGGRYTIDYPDSTGTKIRTIVTDDVLCTVVGNATGRYIVPLGIEDDKHGYFVLPSTTMLLALNATTGTSTFKLEGDCADSVVYQYTPSLSWLENCNIVLDHEEGTFLDAICNYNGDAALLRIFDTYNGEFDFDGVDVEIVRFIIGDCEILTMAESDSGNDSTQIYKILTYMQHKSDMSSAIRMHVTGRLIRYEDGTLICDGMTDSKPFNMSVGSADYVVTRLVNGEEITALVGSDTSKTPAEAVANYFMSYQNKALPADAENRLSRARRVSMMLCRVTGEQYEMLLKKARDTIVHRLCRVLSISAIDKILAPELIDAYKSELHNHPKINAKHKYNADTLSELCNIYWGSGKIPKATDGWNDDFQLAVDELPKPNTWTISTYLDMLDSIDFDVLALEVLSERPLVWPYPIDLEEMQSMYDALCQIEPIRKRFALLEENMVQVQMVFEDPARVRGMLARVSDINSVITTGVSKDTIAEQQSKLETLRKRGVTKDIAATAKSPLRVTEMITEAQLKDSSSLVRYFILSRDLCGLIQELERETEYTAICARLKISLGFGPDDSFEKMEQLEFKSKVDEAQVAECYETYKSSLLKMLYEGMLSDIYHMGCATEVMLYDMVRDFGRFLGKFGEDEVDRFDEVDEEKFYSYANSFVLSYCPVSELAVTSIDSGVPRDVVFKELPDEFILPEHFNNKSVELFDMRGKSLE